MGKKFIRLEKHIEREYESKGYSKKEAEHIGNATAGKIFHEQHGCMACRMHIPHRHG